MIVGPLDVWRACWRYLGAGLSRNNARTREALIVECLSLRLENQSLRNDIAFLENELRRAQRRTPKP